MQISLRLAVTSLNRGGQEETREYGRLLQNTRVLVNAQTGFVS